MQNFISSIFRFFIKLILAAFGLLFAISLLLVALVAVVLGLLKSLITWQKPAPFVIYSQFRQFRQGARSGWPLAEKPLPHSDVVEVEVREIKHPAKDKPETNP